MRFNIGSTGHLNGYRLRWFQCSHVWPCADGIDNSLVNLLIRHFCQDSLAGLRRKLRASFAFNSSLRTLKPCVILERPFLSTSRGFGVIGNWNNIFKVKTLECSFFELFAASGGASLWWAQHQTKYIYTFFPPRGMPNLIPYCGLMPYTVQFPQTELVHGFC